MQALLGGAHVIVDINSSPFHAGKWQFRERMLGTRAIDNSCAFVYLNAVGGQDELVFDGHSLVVGPSGDVVFRCKAFEEQLGDRGSRPRRRSSTAARGPAPAQGQARQSQCEADVPEVELAPVRDMREDPRSATASVVEPPGEVEEIYSALVLGTRDYVNKNGFKEVVLGMSGGIDSALTAVHRLRRARRRTGSACW